MALDTRAPQCSEPLTPLLLGDEARLVERKGAYKIGELLGGCSFGEVHKAEISLGNYVAVKILKPDAWSSAREKRKSVRVVYLLEQCLDHLVHLVKV